MTFISSIKLALRGLRANKKRALLSMLGIIIGVGSVIVIMSVGAGAQSLLINELTSFGSSLFGVTPGAADENGPPASVMGITVATLKLTDAEDLRKIPGVEAVTAYVRGVDTINRDDQKIEATFVGVETDWLKVENIEVSSGRFFSQEENKSLARVAVLGSQVKQDLFGSDEAVGQNIKIKRSNFRVIGIIEERGTVAFENKDKQIYVPIETAQKVLLGISHVSMIRGKVDNIDNMPMILEEARQIIRENHDISNKNQDDFSVRSLDQALKVMTSVTDTLRFFLAGIAAISLLVGGIGIMNIMLVNIAERTHEIGLRKAIGATEQDILKQFLIESASITVAGGIAGILGGVAVSFLIAVAAQQMGYNWDFVLTLSSILLGLGVSALVGLVFGSYPARHAAKLEVVEALRAE